MQNQNLVRVPFDRNCLDLEIDPVNIVHQLPLNKTSPWQSYGGATKNHPCKLNPKKLVLNIDKPFHSIKKIHIVGVFALWGNESIEKLNFPGAVIQGLLDSEEVYLLELIRGIHYTDSTDQTKGIRLHGDRTSLEYIDTIEYAGKKHRIDVLSIDLTSDPKVMDTIIFRNLGIPASFLIFDVFIEASGKSCPFHSHSNAIPLHEVTTYIRMGDKDNFNKALNQLLTSIQNIRSANHDLMLDEARGLALMFISLVSTALLELGAPRSIHKVQLEAARQLEKHKDITHIAEYAKEIINQLTAKLFDKSESTGDPIIDKCIEYIKKMYSQDINDDNMANLLNISTSHFRFLFKKCIGIPYQKYLNAYRLEKARNLIISSDLSISEISNLTGYVTMGNFCRAFKQRFHVSATALRDSVLRNR